MSNPSTIWAQLSLPAAAAGSIPFVDTDNETITTDVTNLAYNVTSGYLNVFGFSSYVAIGLVYGDQGKNVITPITGFNYVFPDVVGPAGNKAAMADIVIFTPAGVLATGTVHAPGAPLDGQSITIFTTQNITALTIQGGIGQTFNSGGPITLAANTSASWLYHLATNTWYRKW